MRLRFYQLICMLTLFSCNLFAGKVDENVARQVAVNFYRHYAPKSKTQAVIIKTIPYKYNGRECFHIISFDKGGFVLVSANDAVTPVLGYGFDHQVPDSITNEAVKGWFDGYARQIDTAFVMNLQQDASGSKWDEILANRFAPSNGDSLGPLLTTTWDQGCYYNEMCPSPGFTCGNVPTGCTATAMGQILKYWNYPEGGMGQHDYIGKFHPEYGRISAFFNETDYNWSNMPSILTTSNQDVAMLLFHCGVASNMDYSPAASGAYEFDALIGMKKYFDYSDSMAHLKRQYYPDNLWKDTIRFEINHTRPVLYVGYNVWETSGHAFVCDGYQGDYFHMNWGWSGSCDGFWLIDNLTPQMLNFNFSQKMVIGIKPKYSALTADFEIHETDSLLHYQFIDFSKGNPDSCFWIFGDGDSSNFRNPLHVFDSAGSYQITQIIYKNSMTDTLTRSVNIIANPFLKSTQVFYGFDGDALFFDYDMDNDLDLLISGYPSGTRMYRNDAGIFTDFSTGIPFRYSDASIDVGDYDNDGDQDIIICGEMGGIRTKLFRNDAGIFTEVQTPFYNVSGTISFVDYNNDGKLDVFLAGSSGFAFKTGLYENLGNQKFKEVNNLPFPSWGQGVKAAWSDLDNDGYNDLVMCGAPGNWDFQTKLFHNNGDETFSELTRGLVNVSEGKIICGDYDSDGDQDILITGRTGMFSDTTVLYRNDSSYFTNIVVPGFDSLKCRNACWGDYDSDGDLDLLLGINLFRNDGNDLFTMVQNNFDGLNASFSDFNNDSKLDILSWGYIGNYKFHFSLFNNMTNFINEAPSATANLHAVVINNDVTFSWNPSLDNTTGINSLSYNIRVGTSASGGEIMAPSSNWDNGYNRVVKPGNIGFHSTFNLKKLVNGKYFWSVQAIDNGYSASDFSVIDSFTVSGNNLPSELFDFTERAYLNTEMAFNRASFIDNYFDPEGDSIQSIRVETLPLTGTLLFNGIPVTVNQIFPFSEISGLHYKNTSLITDYLHLNAYDGTSWGENNAEITINMFVFKQENLGILPEISSFTFSDYDKDGDLDIASSTKIYKNNNGIFQDIGISLSGSGGPNWGDIDSDGNLDLLVGEKIFKNTGNDQFICTQTLSPVLGDEVATFGDLYTKNILDYVHAGEEATTGARISKIFLNSGQGVYEESTLNLLGFRSGATAWCDYDNDGDQDLAICGIYTADNLRKTIIYRNDDGQLIDILANLPGVNLGSLDWGDFDHDGDFDLLLSGSQGTVYNSCTKIFRNDAGVFSEFMVTGLLNQMLPGIFRGFSKWVDVNADGYPDVVLGGFINYPGKGMNIYKNEGGVSFSQISNTGMPNLAYVTLAQGDYNNDGFLDFMISGLNEQNQAVTAIYRNCNGTDSFMVNAFPSVPANPLATTTSNSVVLNWEKSVDNSTNQNSLSYNIYLGKASDSSFVVSPLADITTGFRKVPQIGNTSLDNFWHIDSLQPGTYYWSVQAIDNSFAGSLFAPVQTFTVGSPIPATINIGNDSVGINETHCFNATQTIIMAGNGTSFQVLPGGSVTMIAGQSIIYLPTVIVQAGGYLLGSIATSGPWCQTPSTPSVVAGENEIPIVSEQSSFKVYPNPTAGNFILELTGTADKVQVDIYGMWGEKVFTTILNGERKHEFSLSDKPVGVYFIQVINGDKSETAKIIKQ